MEIIDRVYGQFRIDEPLIVDLIESSPVQRLKGINQTGATCYLDPSRNVNRFEHSVGVWFLLKHFGSTVEEQVAGLLHDTPHTAFSHVVDYVYPNDDHTFHEGFTEKIIMESEIPDILGKHGIKVEHVLDSSEFHLLDAELPDLSADRIDYFLRDTRTDPLFPDSLAGEFLSGIKVRDAKFYFEDQAMATLYATLFIDAGRMLWLDPDSHGSYFLLAGALKRAVEMDVIRKEDLFRNDEEVMGILRQIKDDQVKSFLSNLNPRTRFVYCSQEEADYIGPNKPRVVDPWVIRNGELERVSGLVPRLSQMMEDYKKYNRVLSVKMVKG